MSIVGSFASMPEPRGHRASAVSSEPVLGPAPVVPPPPSSSGGIDPALLQQTKQEIRQIVQEISQLARSDVRQEQFFEEFLPRVVSALAAVGGAIWLADEDGKLVPQYQVSYPLQDQATDPAVQVRHARLLRNIYECGHPTLVPPQSGSTDMDEAGNPTDYLLVLATLKVEQQAIGVLEVFQRAGGGPTTQRGYLRFLVQMAEVAGDYLQGRRLRHLGDRQSLWESLERFLRMVHRGLDSEATAYTIVNESRPLIQCDRVSVALRQGSKYVVRAVSGLDSFDRRAAEVKLLGRLATVVCATGQPFWYAGESRDIPPQVEGPLHEYLDQSHSRLIAVVPLQTPLDESTTDNDNEKPLAEAHGVLIVEKLHDHLIGEGMRERVEAVALHGATALANSIEHQSLFLMPLWKSIGKARWYVTARALPKTLVVLGGLVGGALLLALTPADFDLAARGKLLPSVRQEIFAQTDGVVVDVPVRHEQSIKRDELLCRLNNNDLEVEIANLLGRQHTTQERINNVQRSLLNDRRISVEERNRLDGELLELRQVDEGIERELALWQQKREQLVVRSPMSGQVITWNVKERLLGRPVEKGQALMTVVDPASAWELELYLPERRMGHFMRATRECPKGMTVRYMLASHPGREFSGQVAEVHQIAEVHGDEGNSVILRVVIDKETLPELRSDTTVTARVHCGTRSLGYVWFHDVLETIQAKVLFWLS